VVAEPISDANISASKGGVSWMKSFSLFFLFCDLLSSSADNFSNI